MKKIIFNENGASSVLVIFMMILLVSIGAFAIVSSNANYKFSRKPLEWNMAYFAMDDKAEQYIMDLDVLLSDAESKTLEYFLEGGYEKSSFEGMPPEVQDRIFDEWQRGGKNINALNESINRVYFSFAEKNLTLLSEKYPESSAGVFADGDNFFADAWINFISDTDESSNLNLYLTILPIKYKIVNVDANTTRGIGIERTEDFKRFEISSWNQWQQLREGDGTHDVWIPI